jgi:spore germination protein KA
LEEFIEDNPYSPFPQVLHTERSDRVAQCLLEGRVAIITDGTPIALVVPVDISDFLSSPEDNYQRYLIGSIIRLLRYAALLISFLLPSIYIAISSFHQEMIPTRLNISIAAYRQGVPLPILAEALLMEVVFELLREAGIRLPRSVGQAVSIVGALVIGQAAVQAGLVSPLVVIIVAFTGIASFASPNYNFGLSVRLIRFPLMLLAGSLGIFGILFGIIIISIHLAALRSFGQPYLSPLAPLSLNDVKQKIIRAPRWALDKRPEENSKFNRRRQVPDLKPGYYWHNAGDSKQGEYYD